MTKPAQYDLPQHFDFDLDDGRNLTIAITGEGIIMDVWGSYEPGTEPWTDNETGIDHTLLGTVGMMFDEWADDVVLVYEGRSPSSTLMKESRLDLPQERP